MLTKARENCFPPKSSVTSASFESSIFASASEQKSKEAFSADTSLSLESDSFASSAFGDGTAAALLQNRLFDSTMWATSWPNVTWSALGLNLSPGIASTAATVFFWRPGRRSLKALLTGFLIGAGGIFAVVV